ncbi:MAG: ATP-grasp domain-containing protein [Clostridium sp.]
MRGIIVYSGTLNIKKIEELVFSLVKRGEKIGVEIVPIKNNEILSFYNENGGADFICEKDIRNIDFIIFWDKDILLAKHLERMGYRVFNSGKAIEACDHKGYMHLELSQNGIKMPKTFISPFIFSANNITNDEILKYYKELNEDVIIKESKGSFGMQVYKINNEEEFILKVRELQGKNIDFIMQENINSSFGRDIRVNIIGDKIIGAMYRESKGDFRANITQGARGRVIALSDEQEALAMEAHKSLGLDFSGVDLLFGKDGEPILCEVNSNLNFLSFEEISGINFGEELIKYVVEKCNE